MGKPSPLTYEHAERVVIEESRRISSGSSAGKGGVAGRLPLQTLYGIGDNPETDICGANAYDARIAAGRGLAGGEATRCESILVRSGVYSAADEKAENKVEEVKPMHQHESFMDIANLTEAKFEVDDFYAAVKTILAQENVF